MLDHERHVLDCGTTVLARPLDSNDIVAVRAFVPMGPLYESDEEAGISRLVQQVLTRGTRHRSNHELQEALADLGADLDAGTSADLGSVRIRATSDTWEAVLELFLESLTEPAFESEELATEIERTLGAIDAREDQLLTRAMDLFRDTFYADHPYRKRTLGYRETVRAADRERLVAAADRFYRPVPPIVAAVGRFDLGRLLRRLDEGFGRTPVVPSEPRPAPPEPRSGTSLLEVEREAAYLVHGHPAPDFTDPDYPVARVVDAILGGSMASRLFVELREKRSLAYQVSSLYDDRLEGSFLVGYIVTDPDRAGEAAEGLAAEFRRLIEEPASPEEIDSARRHLRGRYLISAETNAAQASRLGTYEAYALGQDFGDRWLAAVESVTPGAVQGFAGRYFAGEPTRAFVLPAGTSPI